MSSHEIVDLPSKKKLEKMSSAEVEALSASLTFAKDVYLAEYKAKQEQLQALLSEKLQSEQEERIANDPDYWKKHQGVGAVLPRRC